MKYTARILTVLFALSMWGCSDDAADDPSGDTGGGDTGTADTGNGGSDTGGETGTWEATFYRVTEVSVTTPSTVAGILSNIINPEIRDGQLHILIETSEFAADAGATTFMLHGGAGDLTDEGEYVFNGGEASPATVDAEGNFSNDSPTELDFPVLFRVPGVCDGGACPDGLCRTNDDCESDFTCDLEDTGECVQPVVLPLKDVLITGTFEINGEGVQVLSGATLTGAVLKTDADDLEVDLGGSIATLTTILGENRMDWPEEGPNQGWTLGALVNAEAIE